MEVDIVKKKKLRVWYRLWENSDRITIEEKEWAEEIFSNEVSSYDLTFITTDEFLDYLNKVIFRKCFNLLHCRLIKWVNFSKLAYNNCFKNKV